MRKLKLKGFTILELLVVLAIIAILGGVLVPNIISSIIDSRHKTANQNAKLAYNAAAQYCVEYSVQPFAMTGTGATATQVARTSPTDSYLAAKSATGRGLEIVEYVSRQDATNDFVTTLSLEEAVCKELGRTVPDSFFYPIITDNGTGCFVVEAVYWADEKDTRYVGRWPIPIDGDTFTSNFTDTITSVDP